jgi:fatty-acyl-CoA synthase
MHESPEMNQLSRNTDATWVRQQHLGKVIARTARRHPHKEAVVWGDVRQTYSEFNQSVNRVAHAFKERGIQKGDRLAIFSHNSREFLLVYLALAKLGAISVPINFMLKPDEVAFILEHSGASGIAVEDTLIEVAEAAVHQLESMPRAGIRVCLSNGRTTPRDDWEDMAAWEQHPYTDEPYELIFDDDPLQIMYTSGTESRPKGVVLSSRSLISQYMSCIVDGGMTEDDTEIHALPFYHCAQLHCFFGPDMYLGARNIILPSPDPTLVLKTVERERVTKLFAPPTVWISLLRSPLFDAIDLSSLRKGYYGASSMPHDVLKELQSRLPDVQLWNLYGQTEMAPLATILRPSEQLEKRGSAGRASINVETCVVDDEGTPAPAGHVGEIVHRSPHAMDGYWNDAERSADAFRGGWFHSGDLGVMDTEGFLWIVDRKKDMIKSGGENVASREVEEVLFGHPHVAEVAVFGIPHPHWIEAVAAAVVPKDGAIISAESIVEFGRNALSGFKAPKFVVLISELPKNPSGKVLKRELRQQFTYLAGVVHEAR